MGVRNTEGDVVRACLQYLDMLGVWAWRQNQGAVPNGRGGYRKFVGMKGLPDILGILPAEEDFGTPCGLPLAVECKKPGGRLRKDQEAFLATWRAEGGVAFVVSSVKELQDDLKPYEQAIRERVRARAAAKNKAA